LTQRLPIPGSDDGTWGNILNGFLEVSHNGDGTIQTAALVQAGAVTTVNSVSPTNGVVTLMPANLGTGTPSSSNYLRGDGTWVVPNSGSSSLAADSDTAIVGPANNQVLTFNSSAGKWENVAAVNSIAINGGSAQTGAVTLNAVQVAGDISGTATSPTVLTSNGNTIVTTAGNQTIGGTKTFSSTISGNISGNAATVTTNANLTGDVTSSGNATALTSSTNVESIVSANTTVAGALQKTNNLSDVSSASSARTNLAITPANIGALPSTDDLSAIATANATAGNISMNSHKFTGLTSGVAATDSATLTQVMSNLYVNVKDPTYGATGNGTTDDTTAIQAAINACLGGGIVFFPQGTYLISATLQLPDYVTLQGTISRSDSGSVANDGSVIKVANGANLPAVIADYVWYNNSTTNGSYKTVRGISINGNATNQTSGTGIGIVMMSYRAIIDSCNVSNTYGDGIRLTNTARNGTPISSGAEAENRVSSVTIDGTGIANQANNNSGFAVRDSTGSTVTDGFLTDCSIYTSTLYGIYSNAISGWKVDGNHVYSIGGDGIHVINGSFTRITNNYCEFWGQTNSVGSVYGIYAQDSGSGGGTVITGNVVNMNQSGVTGNTFTGICIVDTSGGAGYFTIGANVITSTSTSGTGFAVTGTANNNYVVAMAPQNINGLTTPCSILAFVPIVGDPFAGTQTITFSSTLTPDITKGTVIDITLTGNLTLDIPANLYPGARFSFIFIQDATGGRTVTFTNGSAGQWTGTTFVPTSTANAVSGATFVSDGYKCNHCT